MLGIAADKPDLAAFYGAFAPLAFTLLGLWLVVVQTRHSEWRRSPVHRRRAHVVSINFALPGMMSLLALVDPGNQSLWRVAFAVVSIAAVTVLVIVFTRQPQHTRRPGILLWITAAAVVLYGVVAVVALAPSVVGDLGIHLAAVQVEEIILSVLVFLGVNVAWFLLFEEDPEEAAASEAAAQGERIETR